MVEPLVMRVDFRATLISHALVPGPARCDALMATAPASLKSLTSDYFVVITRQIKYIKVRYTSGLMTALSFI